MSQQTQNLMKKISLGKVVLNMGVGKSGEPIEIGKKALEQITGKKPNAQNAKKSQRDWGIRKGEPIGIAVTVRGNDATKLLKRLLAAKDNQIMECQCIPLIQMINFLRYQMIFLQFDYLLLLIVFLIISLHHYL